MLTCILDRESDATDFAYTVNVPNVFDVYKILSSAATPRRAVTWALAAIHSVKFGYHTQPIHLTRLDPALNNMRFRHDLDLRNLRWLSTQLLAG